MKNMGPWKQQMEVMHMEGKGFDGGLLLQSDGTTAHIPWLYQEVLGGPWRCEEMLSMWKGPFFMHISLLSAGIVCTLGKGFEENKQRMWLWRPEKMPCSEWLQFPDFLSR